MSIAAQLAQLTKLYIAGSGAGAVTITDIVPGNPTICTAVAHGLDNGDAGPFAGIVGTIGTDATNGLNGQTLPVTNITDDTFAVQVDTTGLAYTSDGTFTPTAWTQIKELKGIKPTGSSASKIDVSDLDSLAKEYRTGLVDNGSVTMDIMILESDAGQTAALALYLAQGTSNFKTVSAASVPITRTFNATILKFPTIPDSSVDGVQTGAMDIQVNGAVTVS